MTGDPAADLDLALEAATEAGVQILRHAGGDLEVRRKAPGQPVTAADLAADRLLRERLVTERPAYGWLSEETHDHPDRLGRSLVWVVDPLDGTRSFIAGHPEYAVSIGLVRDGVPIVGVIHNPATGELFWAVRGQGAFAGRVGERRTERLAARPGQRALLLASRSEIAAGELAPFRHDWSIAPLGSTAYKLARVATGMADGFVSRGRKSEWDVCAGTLIVDEAGGRATDLEGRVPVYNRARPVVDGIVAANVEAHASLLEGLSRLPAVKRLQDAAGDPLHPGLEDADRCGS